MEKTKTIHQGRVYAEPIYLVNRKGQTIGINEGAMHDHSGNNGKVCLYCQKIIMNLIVEPRKDNGPGLFY